MKRKKTLYGLVLLVLFAPFMLTGCFEGTAFEITEEAHLLKIIGILDTSFNGTGFVIYNSSYNDLGNAITLDANGKILVAGSIRNSAGHYDMAIWRYHADGTLDTTFNGMGFVIHNSAAGGNGIDLGCAITLDANGKILVVGSSRNSAGNYDMVIWRYWSNGTLDTTFNGTGFVIHNSAAGGNGDDGGSAITIDAIGRILVAGWSTNSSGYFDMVIWRYNANGTLDTTFNGNGFVIHTSAAGGNNRDHGFSITLDANGKILVAGDSWNSAGNYDMVIWRYR